MSNARLRLTFTGETCGCCWGNLPFPRTPFLTARASPGDQVPVRARGIPMAEYDTVETPDLVPENHAVLAAKEAVSVEIERAIAGRTTSEWLERLESAGVLCGVVHPRETVYADAQVVANGLVDDIVQPGVGSLRLLAAFIRVGGEKRGAAAAPELGADTEAVLGAFA